MSVEEKRAKQRAATARWRAKNPPKPLTPEQRKKAVERNRAWRKANPGRHSPYDPSARMRRPWARNLSVRQAHAKKRGIPFTIKVADVRAVWTGRCAITGLPFDLINQSGRAGPQPFSPSLDRIDPAKGYVPGNVRFVLHCVNAFRGIMSDERMKAVARRILDPA